MEVSKADLNRLDQLLKLLKRAQHKLVGLEVMSAAQVYTWVNGLDERFNQAYKDQIAAVESRSATVPSEPPAPQKALAIAKPPIKTVKKDKPSKTKRRSK